MKASKLFCFVCFVLFGFSGFSQTTKNLNIYFYEQPLMFFAKNDKSTEYSGVEADILKEFIKWCDEKKKIKVIPKYYGYKTFNEFYGAMQSAPENTIGAGTTTITEERKQSFDFSVPYLNNVALFVSQGSVPTIESAEPAAVKTGSTSRPTPAQTQGLVGLIEKGSVHATYMSDLVKNRSLNISMQPVEGNLNEVLASDPKYVTYMDIISYRELLKNTDKYFKIHRALSVSGEKFGYMLPKNSEWLPLINEFMEGGFGFTATRKYENILETYLGYEVISTVERF